MDRLDESKYPSIYSPDETPYIKKRFINYSGCLVMYPLLVGIAVIILANYGGESGVLNKLRDYMIDNYDFFKTRYNSLEVLGQGLGYQYLLCFLAAPIISIVNTVLFTKFMFQGYKIDKTFNEVELDSIKTLLLFFAVACGVNYLFFFHGVGLLDNPYMGMKIIFVGYFFVFMSLLSTMFSYGFLSMVVIFIYKLSIQSNRNKK